MQTIRVLLLGLALSLLAALPARAVTILRDADLEYGLRQLATPVLRAANLSPSQVRILIVDDPTLNAFVTDTQHIFVNSGLILQLDSAEAMQAVLAHEAALFARAAQTFGFDPAPLVAA